MHYQIRPTCTILTLTVLLCAVGADAQDWPNWRGPNHDGMSTETGLQTQWDASPPVVWRREIGSAFSAITCVGGKVLTCGTQDKQQVLFCLDAQTGSVLWQTPFETEFRDRNGGDGTRGTPTVDDGRVYVEGALGRLVCCDADSGKVVWDRQFDAKPQWGYAGSVLMEGDLAITSAGSADGPLVALDKKTGEIRWKCGSPPTGYSTPLAFTLEGQRYVAGFLGDSIVIAEMKTGREVWSKPWKTSWDVNAATPIFHDGQLFFSSGYEHGAIVVRLARAGDRLNATPVWDSQEIRAKFQSPVLYQGHLYTSDEVGLKCVEFATGQEKWSQRDIKHGTVVIADGHLFVLTERGQLLIGPATPAGFEPTTDVPILKGRCWTVPTLCHGHLYARDFEQIVCLRLTP